MSGDTVEVPQSDDAWYLHVHVSDAGHDDGVVHSAPFQKETYTVVFDSQGGSTVASVTGVSAGAMISAPTVPTREGYTFVGWYKEASGDTEWNFATDTVSANVTLYAKWTAAPVDPDTYTVTFDSQGGSAVASATGVIAGAKISEPTAPTRARSDERGVEKEASGEKEGVVYTETVCSNVRLVW